MITWVITWQYSTPRTVSCSKKRGEEGGRKEEGKNGDLGVI